MKTSSLIMAASFLLISAVVCRGAVATRISSETGVSVATLQSERATTGLGWGELEKAHLLANASGKSFTDIVAMHKAGEGWGKIAHDNGLKLGKIVSTAHRPGPTAFHHQMAHVSATARGNARPAVGKGPMSTARGIDRSPSVRSSAGTAHGMGSMGRGHGGR